MKNHDIKMVICPCGPREKCVHPDCSAADQTEKMHADAHRRVLDWSVGYRACLADLERLGASRGLGQDFADLLLDLRNDADSIAGPAKRRLALDRIKKTAGRQPDARQV